MVEVVVDQGRADLGGNMHHGDLHAHCPMLWRFLVERFAVHSVLDVGCGEGQAVAFFRRLGCIAHGIDGLRINVIRSVSPIALHDLTQSSYFMPVDMVWSCEVAEHISEEKVDYYVETLANGRVIAMTHGLPGQDGYHHVNCQQADYWIAKLTSRGYRLDDRNEKYKEIARMDATYNYFSTSGLVFCKM